MRVRRLLGLVAATSLLVATIAVPTSAQSPGESSAPSAAPSQADVHGQSLHVAKVGDAAFDDVAVGRWKDQISNVDGVNLTYDNVDSPDTALRAVVSGAADMALAMSLTDLVNLVGQTGSDAKLVAADTYASDYQLVSQASIATPKDLEGKSLGISAPGDASELVGHICLNNEGVDYSKVNLVQVGGTGARVAALQAGQIDAGAAHIADAQAAVNASAGKLKILLDCGKIVGNYPVTGMVTSSAWIAAHPDLAQVAVNEYVNAMRWAATNKDEFLTFAQTWVPDMDPTVVGPSYDYFDSVGFWPVNGGIDDQSIQKYLGYATQTNVIPAPPPATDTWVDQSLVNNYLAANGSK